MLIPRYVDLGTWASSLIIDFPQENIPILNNTKDWKVWGNEVIQLQTFAAQAAPPTNSYADWREWAQSLYLAMSNY